MWAATGRAEARLSLANLLADQGACVEAVRHIAAAAREGSAEAQSRLGFCYLRGHGVPASQDEARHWLELAAEGGDLSAQIELASLAMRGISGPYERAAFPEKREATEPDFAIAAALARRAVTHGSAEAQALLALILSMAPENATGEGESEDLYRASAEAGWPLGQLGHAMTLMREGSDPAFREARRLVTAAANTGLPTAHFALAAMAEAGAGGTRDMELATRHFRIAAEQGHTGGKTRLGLALLLGRGVKRNLIEGETWLRRAAIDGDRLAAAALGDFHASPERDPANLEEATQWYRRAAELGHPGAARALARMISTDDNDGSGPGEAATWLRTAIEGGETAAWTDLGKMIVSSAIPREQLPALHGWLQTMIRNDRPEAGFYVGLCVNCGIGTPANEKLARRYYLWAATQGVIEAMAAAAEMLANGRGGRADPALARALFDYAGEHGHAGALYALALMTTDDELRSTNYLRRAAELGHLKARLLLRGSSPVP
jgi:TPR repeat protein